MVDKAKEHQVDGPAQKVSSAAIVLIGDELLSGKIRDANGALLIDDLRALGIEVTELHMVSDRIERIVEAIELVRHRNDVVFTSGGVGPTHDDKTLDAVAEAFGVDLEAQEELLSRIRARFGDDPDNPWLKMGHVPAGCDLLFHEDTRWPVMRMGNVYVLPGVPQLFSSKTSTSSTTCLVPHPSRVHMQVSHLSSNFLCTHQRPFDFILN